MMWRRVAAHRKSAENAHPHYITASRSASAADVTASHRRGRFARVVVGLLPNYRT